MITEFIKPADNGMTSPYLCRLENGAAYYVKGRRALARGLIGEVVAARLGRAFGLPIPDFAIVRAPQALLNLDENALSAIGPGPCFASALVPNLAEMPDTALQKIGRPFQQRLFLFDYWIKNEDRTGVDGQGNPNLFLNLQNNAPAVFDHNLAFDEDFIFERNRALHVCAPGWFNPTIDLIYPQTAMLEMTVALETSMHDIENAIPAEWLEDAPGHIYETLAILGRYERAEFWDPLK